MGQIRRYLEWRRVLRLLAELDRSLDSRPGTPSRASERPTPGFSLASQRVDKGRFARRSTPG